MNTISYDKIRERITARRFISALERDGFKLSRSTGSHHLYKHSDGRRVTVTYHRSGDTFKTKTLKSMIEYQACWTEEDLRCLKLIKSK